MLDEILQNIIKHANATTVAISFLVGEDLFIISVTDNGMGFNKGLAKKGIGLKNLKARANKLNGELAINSKIGTGTTVAIHFSKNMT
jgi:signal transduction histidine kinase